MICSNLVSGTMIYSTATKKREMVPKFEWFFGFNRDSSVGRVKRSHVEQSHRWVHMETVFTGQVCCLASKKKAPSSEHMLLSWGCWPCHYSLHISWPLEIPTLQFSHTCSIHLAARQVSIRAVRLRGKRSVPPHVYASKYVSVFTSGRGSRRLSSGSFVSQGKQVCSQTSSGLEANCQSRDTDGIFKRQKLRLILCLCGVFFFFSSLSLRGLSRSTCVKVCFVFAAGLRHKASGSWLVKCWWRYYKVKSRVYKPAVCMVRAFPAEQWVSELVW